MIQLGDLPLVMYVVHDLAKKELLSQEQLEKLDYDL